jgi:hypothetical protein
MMPLALLPAAVLLVLLPKRSEPFAWACAGFVLMVCALLVTLAVEVPIDNQIKVSTAASLPAIGKRCVTAGSLYHTLRTFLSIAALIAVTTSTLSDRP